MVVRFPLSLLKRSRGVLRRLHVKEYKPKDYLFGKRQSLGQSIYLMKYYSIQYATSKIGRAGYPQVVENKIEDGKMVTDPDYIWNVSGDTLPRFHPYVGTLLLRNGWAVSAFKYNVFVCSDKVANLVNQHSLGETYFYEFNGIKHKDKLYDNYKLMHCLNNYADKIDFERSEFRRLKLQNNQKVGEPYKVDSLEQVLKTKKELSKNTGYGTWMYLEPFSIRFKENFLPKHDIFKIWGASYDTYISERLREAFEKSKVTGIQYDFDSKHVDFS